MKSIQEYLKQNEKKYEDQVFQLNNRYSLYEDYLLLNTLKEYQDKIYANNMYFQLTQIKIKNSKRTLKSYYQRLYLLIDDLEMIQNKYANKKCRNEFEINENIIKHLNLLIDAEVLQMLQKYVDQHKEQLKNLTKNDFQYIQKPFTLLEDCTILKTFKQKINQNGFYKSIMKCLSEKLKRKKTSILRRLQNLFNCNKQKLIFCISNNYAIKIKPKKQIKSRPIIQNMKIIVNQLILKQLKQQIETKNWHNSSKLNTQTIQHLIILMYVKKYAGQLSLQQIFLIISKKMHLSKNMIHHKFYFQILPNLRNSLSGSQLLQKYFKQIQTKVQSLEPQQRKILKVISKQNSFKDNDNISNLSSFNAPEIDTLSNKISQSRLQESDEQMIDMLKQIQFPKKAQDSYFASQSFHQDLFFSDEQQKQEVGTEIDTLINMLNQSKGQKDQGAFIEVLKKIQLAVKNDQSYVMEKTFSQNLFFSGQESMNQTKISNDRSLCIEVKNSKKYKKNEKTKRKSSKMNMAKLQSSDVTLTESLDYQHNLEYCRKKWHLNNSKKADLEKSSLSLTESLDYQHNLEYCRKKWNLNNSKKADLEKSSLSLTESLDYQHNLEYCRKKWNLNNSKKAGLEKSNLSLTESLDYQHNLEYCRKKWHLNPKEDEETVLQDLLQIKEGNNELI